ncbi:Aldehyde/histidinol dehydrogenase [Jimgerdemannia flammicorona]|uniref:Aldehyde/histidinol dehydrogenase n=1 Tax=Jimgerdemannia flammicorona TaxID=994334 RepID=A0A433CZC4_9FUNG|nr:Aldehyde/histidinol dehydrogenase [Jimgerdemannia flammicorona]
MVYGAAHISHMTRGLFKVERPKAKKQQRPFTMTTEAISNLKNFINGQYLPPTQGKHIDSFNPAKAEVHARIPDSTAEDVEMAIVAAERAFQHWSETKREARAAILNKIAEIIERRIEEFAQAESNDQGKPVWYARAVDITRSAYNFRFFAGQILYSHEQLNKIDGVATNYSLRQPVGVAGLISPWNLSLYLLTWKIAPCIACMFAIIFRPLRLGDPTSELTTIPIFTNPDIFASQPGPYPNTVGNTCVCKPSEFTSLTAYRKLSHLAHKKRSRSHIRFYFSLLPPLVLCSVLKEAGLPDGVVNMVFGTGANAGQALVEHPRVPLISFTGGELTNKFSQSSLVISIQKKICDCPNVLAYHLTQGPSRAAR